MFGKKKKKIDGGNYNEQNYNYSQQGYLPQEQLQQGYSQQGYSQENSNNKKRKEKNIEQNKTQQTAKLKRSPIRFVRVLLWIVIVFIFIRGTVTLVRGDQVLEIKKQEKKFLQEMKDERAIDSKALSFAESFVNEYFQFSSEEEKEEYLARLSSYINPKIENDIIIPNECWVDYVQAYDLKTYTDNQVDVYVYAIVVKKVPEDPNNPDKSKMKYESEDVYLKVPIYYDKNNNLLVEDIPSIVGKPDNAKYPNNTLDLSTVSGTQASEIKSSIEEFLKAYYEANQKQVDYFLLEPGSIKTASNKDIYKYESIEAIEAYELSDDRFLVTVKYKITDYGVETRQKNNFIIAYQDDKYMIKEMNARITNIDISKGEN